MKVPFYFIVLLTCFSCKKEIPSGHKTSVIKSEKSTDISKKITTEEQIKILNDEILQALKSRNYTQFLSYIHPEKGVRFSMYAYLNPENKIFRKKDFEKYISTNVKFTWGSRDGSGEPLILSIKDYLETWVFKKDYTQSQYTYKVFQGSGNSLNNLEETYPKHLFTENYIPGTEKYPEMDWNSLRFVFEELNGKHYLIAIINDQWTI